MTTLAEVPSTDDFVTHFADAAEWTGVRDRRGEDEDTDPAWLDLRRTMLTASDVAAVLGEDEYRSALDVYLDKTTPRVEHEEPGLDSPLLWGSVLEQPILRTVARKMHWTYFRGGALLRSRAHPELGATLDAEVDRDDDLGWIVLEGKTSRVPRWWNEEEGTLPTRVLIQAQSQLLVTGAPAAVVFVLLQGSRPCRIEVQPSRNFHSVIVEEAERFMDLVARLEPPDPDGSKSSTRALARMYPDDDGGFVWLPSDAVAWTREYQELGETLKRMKTRREHMRNLLKASIGAATYGLLPEPAHGKGAWRWRPPANGGARRLTPLREPPPGIGSQPMKQTPQLEAVLRESVDLGAAVVPINRKRRRARR